MQTNSTPPMGSAEASERLGLSRDTLVRMVAAGTITKAKKMRGVSGAWLFDREEIEQLATDREQLQAERADA